MITLRPRLSGTPASKSNSCSLFQLSSPWGNRRQILYCTKPFEPISGEKHKYLMGLFCVWCGGWGVCGKFIHSTNNLWLHFLVIASVFRWKSFKLDIFIRYYVVLFILWAKVVLFNNYFFISIFPVFRVLDKDLWNK